MSSQDYVEMIEIPVSGCEMVTEEKPSRKKNKKRFIKKFGYGGYDGAIKEEKSFSFRDGRDDDIIYNDADDGDSQNEYLNEDEYSGEYRKGGDKSSFTKGGAKWNIISVQVVTILILAIGIILTNVFWKDSGMNNLFKTVFSSNETVKDERSYDTFQAFSPSRTEVTVENGVITLSNAGAIYSPCNGKVLSVTKSNDKYSITIGHSDFYKTVITGADYAYVSLGDEVFTTTPVSYAAEQGCQVAMYNQDKLITTFTVEDGKVVWQS